MALATGRQPVSETRRSEIYKLLSPRISCVPTSDNGRSVMIVAIKKVHAEVQIRKAKATANNRAAQHRIF